MSHWTTQSGAGDLFWPQIGRGVALGLMFVPLSMSALRSLPPQDMLQGAGLYNLFRQTGGSMGIAVLATLIDHRGVLHHTYLSERLAVLGDDATAPRGAGVGLRRAHGCDARSKRRHALDAGISAQSVLAFRDCYLVISCSSWCSRR
jgi:DHA2 family multidrug resistance protein